MATTIYTVAGKGAPLNVTEFDLNLTNLKATADGAAAGVAVLTDAYLFTTVKNQAGPDSNFDADTVDGSHASAFAPAINTASDALASADTTIGTADTWTDGPSLSLGVGTWLIMGHVELTCDGGADRLFAGRIYDSTGLAELASLSTKKNTSGSPCHAGLSMSAIVTLTGSSTIKLQGACSITTNAAMKYTSSHMSGAKATQIVAIQVA